MSRTVLAQVEGFTPVIDRVVKDTGSHMTALVFGRMWRFCQMKDGVCNASLEKIAESLGISRTTVMTHAKKLVEAGYLEDRSPDLRNHPHTYADTGKASLHIGVSAGVDVNLLDVENDDVNLLDADVNLLDTSVNLTHLKIDSKKEPKKDKEVVNLKSQAASMLSSRVVSSDSLKDIIQAFKPDMIIDYCHAYDQALKDGTADSPGWLVKALRQQWDIKKLLDKREKELLQDEPERYVTGKLAEFVEH